MSLTEDDVKKIAYLSRLQITEQAIPEYVENLSSIFDLVDQMNAVDTSHVETMAHPLHMIQRLREDVVTESNQRDIFQRHAPETEAGLYLVPKVIE